MAVDWVLSSRAIDIDVPIEIDSTPQVLEVSAGGLYLAHTTAALNMLQQLYLAMVAAGVASPAAVITKGRRVKLSSSGIFTIDWTSTELRDLLGFSANLSGASSYVAPAQSQLLWSPGRPYSPMLAPLDAVGVPSIDASVTVGPRGVQTVRQHGLPTYLNRVEFRRVPKARWWADPLTNPNGAAGDYRHFWREELWSSRKIVILRHVTEGADGNTDAADYSSSHVLGPYVADLSAAKAQQFPMERVYANVEKFYNVELELIVTAEYSA